MSCHYNVSIPKQVVCFLNQFHKNLSSYIHTSSTILHSSPVLVMSSFTRLFSLLLGLHKSLLPSTFTCKSLLSSSLLFILFTHPNSYNLFANKSFKLPTSAASPISSFLIWYLPVSTTIALKNFFSVPCSYVFSLWKEGQHQLEDCLMVWFPVRM